MPSPPSASLEGLEKSSREDIIKEIDFHLAQANSTIAEFRKAYHVLQAQVLIQTLAAREQRKQTNVMVGCTIIITVLTVIITSAHAFSEITIHASRLGETGGRAEAPAALAAFEGE